MKKLVQKRVVPYGNKTKLKKKKYESPYKRWTRLLKSSHTLIVDLPVLKYVWHPDHGGEHGQERDAEAVQGELVGIAQTEVAVSVQRQLLDLDDQVELHADVLVRVALEQEQGTGGVEVL